MTDLRQAVIKNYHTMSHDTTWPLVELVREPITISELKQRASPIQDQALFNLYQSASAWSILASPEMYRYPSRDLEKLLAICSAGLAFRDAYVDASRNDGIYPTQQHEDFLLALQNAYEYFSATERPV